MAFSFEQAKEAFHYLADQKHFGKVVIQIVPESGRGRL